MAESPGRWATALLNRLGIQPNPANTRAVVGWAKAEGGHWNNQARFNPLNTTQPMPGAGNTGSQGNIKQYKDWEQGLDATVKTLRNGRYGGILNALKSGNESAVVNAVGNSPWGTDSGLLARVLGSKTPTANSTAAPATETTTTTRTTPGVDRSRERGQLISQFLNDKNADPVDLALGVRELRDTPGRTVTDISAPSGGTTPRGRSPLLELFWQGAGGVDVKNGQKVPQGFVSGHQDHVHVAAGPKTVVALGKLAQRMGLQVGENSQFTGQRETSGHAPNSYHYKDQAIDVSGDPNLMRAFAQRVAQMYGIKP